VISPEKRSPQKVEPNPNQKPATTMDSRIGLDYIVENRDYIAKLGAALDTQNATVKKQVFELLSALCAYSPDGYARAIETLEFYKVSGGSEGYIYLMGERLL